MLFFLRNLVTHSNQQGLMNKTQNIMKKQFHTRLGAIDWLASFSSNEHQFESLREQLLYNHLYTGELFVQLNKEEALPEVIWLK